jgi:hypothetical protein
MFHFPGYGIRYLCIQYRIIPLHGIGLLHSEISGSTLVCSSPKLIAAYRVLHRLPMPRHPSCALSSLTTKESTTHRVAFGTLACAKAPIYSLNARQPALRQPAVHSLNYSVVKELKILASRFPPQPAAYRGTWWAYLDSNQRPRPYQRRALTN